MTSPMSKYSCCLLGRVSFHRRPKICDGNVLGLISERESFRAESHEAERFKSDNRPKDTPLSR